MKHSWLLAFVFSAILIVACGDDDSSSFVEPEKESSDSSSDSSASVSSSSTNSSSSAKSSSSVNSSAGGSSAKSSSSGKNTSASSSAGGFSSSLPKELQCLVECTEACEGETYWHGSDYQMVCHGGQWLNLDSMEQANAPSSSSYFDMTEHFNPDVEYGEFTDPRDGQKYRTVSLKDGVYYTDSLVFFAENLNFGKMISGGAVQGDSTKYCYDDDPWYCENGWGGLYTWSRAMNLPSVCDSVELGSEKCNYTFARDKDGKLIDGEIIHQGICPEGWHIANDGEWAYLQEKSGNSVAYLMGSKVAGFGSKNSYGLSILPAGEWNSLENRFEVIAEFAIYWTSQQHLEYEDCAYAAMVTTNEFNRSSRSGKGQGLSVRCVKDY